MKWCFEDSVLQDPCSHSSDHDKISMANVNINALYAGSLRINVAYVFLSYFTFNKWCVTKVAHCIFDFE